MDITIFVFMLFGLQFFYWLVGRRSSKNVTGKEDYFLAGKSVQLFPLMMTFFATQVGGGVVLGSAEEAYQYGWVVLFYPLGAALGLILLGSGVGRRLAGFQVSTVAQIFEAAYGSMGLRRFASMLSVVSLFMVLVAQIIASNKFLASLGLSNTSIFIAFWAIVILYTAQGGLKAVISTDFVQAAFFSIAAIFFAFYFDNIVDLLIQSYELSVSCLFIPVAIALFKKHGRFLAALSAVILGTVGFFLFRIYPVGIPKEIASLLLSLLGYSCGELIASCQTKIMKKADL